MPTNVNGMEPNPYSADPELPLHKGLYRSRKTSCHFLPGTDCQPRPQLGISDSANDTEPGLYKIAAPGIDKHHERLAAVFCCQYSANKLIRLIFIAFPRKLVGVEDTIKGFKGIVAGDYDHLPEAAFYMVGGIEEVVEKAKKLAAD